MPMKYNLEIEKQNRIRQFCSSFRRNIEEKLFNLLLKVPEKLIPKIALEWVGIYLEKRNQELKIHATQINYNNAYLERAARELKK